VDTRLPAPPTIRTPPANMVGGGASDDMSVHGEQAAAGAAVLQPVPGAIMDSWLSKRAQGRSRLGRCNWKNRRFLLRPTELQYWSSSECKGKTSGARAESCWIACPLAVAFTTA